LPCRYRHERHCGLAGCLRIVLVEIAENTNIGSFAVFGKTRNFVADGLLHSADVLGDLFLCPAAKTQIEEQIRCSTACVTAVMHQNIQTTRARRKSHACSYVFGQTSRAIQVVGHPNQVRAATQEGSSDAA
jgi:hypothetical protein